MKNLIALAVVALVACACNQNKSDPPAAAAAPAAAPSAAAPTTPTTADPAAAAPTMAAAAPSAAAPTAAAPAGAVPTEEDYEQKASSAITTTNAAQELTAIEKEIGQ
jgi:hypothetical protein